MFRLVAQKTLWLQSGGWFGDVRLEFLTDSKHDVMVVYTGLVAKGDGGSGWI